MATPRISRQSSSSPSTTTAQSRAKRSVSSNKKTRQPKQIKHRAKPTTAYRQSVAAVARGIDAIKRKLVAEAPSHEILDDFFERITGEPSFVFEFRRGPSWLCDAIARACEEILDKPTGESTVYLIAVPEHDLVHGSVVIGGYTGTAVFFEDIRLGAIGLYPEQESRGSCFVRLVMIDGANVCQDVPN